MRSEIEDGMGFAGLLPDRHDREIERLELVNARLRKSWKEDTEQLKRERDQAAAIVGELAALIPIPEAVAALQSGATMVAWFKKRLSDQP